MVTFSGVVGNNEATVSPFVRVPGGITSKEGKGPSIPITITFLQPVKLFRVTVKEIKSPGNFIEIYDSKGQLTERYPVEFTGGGKLSTNQTVQITKEDIKIVKLIPAPGDYVWYAGLIIKDIKDDKERELPPIPKPSPSVTPVPEPPIVPPTYVINEIIKITIAPIETPELTKSLEFPVNVLLKPIEVNLSRPIIDTAFTFLQSAIASYIDEERDLKTLLNYGEDRQSVILNYRYGPTNDTLQLKLLQPIPENVDTGQPVFISREVAKTLIDKVRIRFAPPLDATPYLRPKNTYIDASPTLGKYLKNVTLTRLALESGSVGATDPSKNITFEDEIFRKWYSYDFNSSELNIDFTDYNNFIFYSSAQLRLAAFREKLKQIEALNLEKLQFSGSLFTGSTASAGAIYLQEKSAETSKQIEDIIRGFDRHEQYLYFTSASNNEYTASAYYADEGYEFNTTAYWPKTPSGSLENVYSATAEAWYTTQSAIAQRFDEFNENNLVNTIPTHIREHEENAAYITFVGMIGHFFDTIKPYIDQFPYINSRYLNPDEELSKDLVNEIAEAVGFKLPTVNSLYSLSDNILGTDSKEPRRDYTVETYKRLLHNLPLFAKSKGTKTALDALMRSLGVSSELITIKESGAPTTSSFYVFDEYSTGLDFDRDTISYIKLPFSSSNRQPASVQFNCSLTQNRLMTIVNGDDKWSLICQTHPSSSFLGRIDVTSGSNNAIILSTDYDRIFDDDLINISIQSTPSQTTLRLIKTDGDEIEFDMSASVGGSTFNDLWSNTEYLYVGGSGSIVLGRYDGTFDEIRVWGKSLEDSTILNTAFDPGSNAGDTYTDASDFLYEQVSFNIVDNALLVASSSIINESPYKNITQSPSLEYFDVYNVTTGSLSRYSRTVRQLTALAGATIYSNNKVKVAEPPVFAAQSLDKNGTKKLSRTTSIVTSQQKRLQAGKNKVLVSLSPTEIINQNIIRSLGLENINDILGLPSEFFKTSNSIEEIRDHYNQYYYVDVNFNKYIRIVSDLSSVLDQLLSYFIPSKAVLLNGIVIEPSILEKTKIPTTRGIKAFGSKTRNTVRASSTKYSGSKPDYSATFNLSKTIEAIDLQTPSATYNAYQTQIDDTHNTEIRALINTLKTEVSGSPELSANSSTYAKGTIIIPEKNVLGNYILYSASVDMQEIVSMSVQHITKTTTLDTNLSNVNKIKFNATNRGAPGAEPYNRVYSRKLFDFEIDTIRIGGRTSLYEPALKEIIPSTDFRDYGVINYFNSENGVYNFPIITKTPVYVNPLNQAWDETQQSFIGVATWSYGERFNYNDVVYQEVTNEDTILGKLTGSAQAGNGRYYVFTSKPLYTAPETDIFYYSGSVVTYIPPSLDKENWALLKFRPTQRRKPRRVVFDTFRVPIPSLNNFKTTTISIDQTVDLPDRFLDSYNIALIEPSSYAIGDIIAQNMLALFALQANTSNIRVRFYRTAAARDADLNRSISTLPTGSHGVLLDTVLNTANVVELTNPIPTILAGESPPNAKIFYTINNLTPTSKIGVTFSIYYFTLQIEPRVPLEYLRKHYKFFRDNSTATKRRNYEGCKNTVDTTIDGEPPVQIFLSEGTDIVVSQTQTQDEIITGGGGTLNVT